MLISFILRCVAFKWRWFRLGFKQTAQIHVDPGETCIISLRSQPRENGDARKKPRSLPGHCWMRRLKHVYPSKNAGRIEPRLILLSEEFRGKFAFENVANSRAGASFSSFVHRITFYTRNQRAACEFSFACISRGSNGRGEWCIDERFAVLETFHLLTKE